MDREASFLRCSKLSCYAEFNRMVQVVAKIGSLSGGGGHKELQRGGTGTSAEYHFYYTLSAMLREIVRNTDPTEQKKDLQKVYSWYCLNKPILKAKTKRGQTKPLLSLKTTEQGDNGSKELSRPQTAPASLCQGMTPLKTGPAFTSSYIRRSMMAEIQSVSPGQTFDELQTTQMQLQPPKTVSKRPKSSGSIQKSAPQHPRFSKESEITTLSVVEFPSEDTFSGKHHHRRPATVPAAVSCEQLFNLTSGVAANMVLDKEMRLMREKFIRRRTVSAQTAARSSSRLLVSSPIERPQTTKERAGRQVRGSQQETVPSTPTKTNEATSPPTKQGTFLLKGKSLNVSESDKPVAMETIQEERLSSASLYKPTNVDPGKVDELNMKDETKALKFNNHPKQEKNSPQYLSTTITEQNSGNHVSKAGEDQETDQTPLSAKVTLRNQLSQSEQGKSNQQTAGQKGKRVVADLKITTLGFLEEEQIIPRAQGRKSQGQLHKHRPRPHTVHSQTRHRTDLSNVSGTINYGHIHV